MKKLILHVALLTTLFAGSVRPADKEIVADEDDACNCDHCTKTNDDNDETAVEIPSAVLPLNKEDADADGLLQICARSRDLPDRSFPTVCHMLCQNRCTRFNVTEVIEGKMKRYIAKAYRTNYYKLRDGPCEKV